LHGQRRTGNESEQRIYATRIDGNGWYRGHLVVSWRAEFSQLRFQRNATICTSANFDAAVPTCTASTDWSNGWIVWVDKDRDGATDANEMLAAHAPIDDTTTFSSTTAALFTYDARGFGASPADNLTMCDSRTGEMGRSIKVNNVGRTNVSRQGC
jgi:type IV fimbrial biogenesis protein FimT